MHRLSLLLAFVSLVGCSSKDEVSSVTVADAEGDVDEDSALPKCG